MLVTYYGAYEGDIDTIAIPWTLGTSLEETRTLAKRVFAKRRREANDDEDVIVTLCRCELDIHAVVFGDGKFTKRELMERAQRVYGTTQRAPDSTHRLADIGCRPSEGGG